MSMNTDCIYNEGSWIDWEINSHGRLEASIVVENVHQGKIRIDREEALKLHAYLEENLRSGEIK